MKTKPIIEKDRLIEQAKARSEVMEEGRVFTFCDSASDLPYYKVYADEEGTNLLGYVFTAEGRGYSSTALTIAGVDTAYNLIGIKVFAQQETPGLGSRCQEVKYRESEPWFQRQFFAKYRLQEGMSVLSALKVAVDKDGGEIQSITGATVTGRAIANSVKQASLALKEKLETGR
jgi:electron transport complex protein RnfG